jgi:branched-chain amino acid transport system permease protein
VRAASRRSLHGIKPSQLFVLAVGLLAGLVGVLMTLGHFSDFDVFTTSTIAIYAIAALGQDWLIGQAGQVSLGGAAFMAVGAFTVAGTDGTPLGSWPIQLALAGVLGAGFGFVVGLPALRLRGMYLLLSTLAFQFIMLFITNEYQGDRPIGFVIPAPHIGSWAFDTDRKFLGFVLVILLVSCLFSFSVQRHAPGRYWRTLRESELAAASLGINVPKWKLLAFVGSSAETAVAGALYAMLLGIVTFDIFSFSLALSLGVMVFFGGRSTISGPILGAAAVTLLPQGLTSLSNTLGTSGTVGNWFSTNQAVIVTGVYGLALLVVLLGEPDGIVGLLRKVAALPERTRARQARQVQAVATTTDRVDPVTVAALPVGPGSPLIETIGLNVRYPNGALGIENFTISVETGTIVALVGRNGAGKTTALRAIAGFPRAERTRLTGVMRLGGLDVNRHDPVSMRAAGVVLVPERNKVFPTLTVLEHLRLAGLAADDVDAMLERFAVLKPLRSRRAGLLSGGERQMLALAAATAARPKLLLIDEPSLGLSPVATQTLVAELMRLRDESGMTVLLTEQVTETVESVADSFCVLDRGQILFAGGAADLRRPEVRAAVMGR